RRQHPRRVSGIDLRRLFGERRHRGPAEDQRDDRRRRAEPRSPGAAVLRLENRHAFPLCSWQVSGQAPRATHGADEARQNEACRKLGDRGGAYLLGTASFLCSVNRGSVPASRRRAFCRWRSRTTTAVAPAAAIAARDAPVAAARSGVAQAATIDASETQRQAAKTTPKTSTAQPVAAGTRTASAPSAVATPLPPANRSVTGKTWPATAATAAAAGAASPGTSATATGTAPFAASASSVSAPRRPPAVRATLLAPMFPLPLRRTSTPARRARRRPNGIEPQT